jgi:hypothetical protein
MLCLTSKSYQLCKPRQADIREQLHGLGPKTDVDIVTLNPGRLNVDQNSCFALKIVQVFVIERSKIKATEKRIDNQI